MSMKRFWNIHTTRSRFLYIDYDMIHVYFPKGLAPNQLSAYRNIQYGSYNLSHTWDNPK